jgi:hypothetical protein
MNPTAASRPLVFIINVVNNFGFMGGRDIAGESNTTEKIWMTKIDLGTSANMEQLCDKII